MDKGIDDEFEICETKLAITRKAGSFVNLFQEGILRHLILNDDMVKHKISKDGQDQMHDNWMVSQNRIRSLE